MVDIFALASLGILITIAAFIIYIILTAFRSVGFTFAETATILFLSILLYIYIPNIPLFKSDNVVIGINVAGAVIPIFLSLRMLEQRRAPAMESLLGIAIITYLAYNLSEVVPEEGILLYSYHIPVVTASLIGVLAARKKWSRAGPCSYVSGSIGILIGADILHLQEVLNFQHQRTIFAVIGGAGIFDAIFIVGILAVLIDIFLKVIFRD
ncbi:MAG: DUF1614 domain-containing protein [Methanocellales archaeon]